MKNIPRLVDETTGLSNIVPIRLPFDIPLTSYTDEDECWTWDVHYGKPDLFGNIR